MDVKRNLIDIKTKSGDKSIIVSLRSNDTIVNLRSLVAMKFERLIDHILLVFAGQVLQDVGTVDQVGITAGVTVHVLFRELCSKVENESNVGETDEKSVLESTLSRLEETLKRIVRLVKTISRPELERNTLDASLNKLLEEAPAVRHHLRSDRDMSKLMTIYKSAGAMQEMTRLLSIATLHSMHNPKAYGLMQKITSIMLEIQDDMVAAKYQVRKSSHNNWMTYDNPQRGLENKCPLPNPWIALKPSLCQANSSSQLNFFITFQFSKKDKIYQDIKVNVKATKPSAQALPCPLKPSDRKVSSIGKDLVDLRSQRATRWDQLFESELLHLSNLGYTDRSRSIRALLTCFGNVQDAANLLEQWKTPK